MSKANDIQVGGDHYKVGGEELWDRIGRLGLDYFQGSIIKYVERWRKKNGLEDLKKAQHYLQKYIELCEPKEGDLCEESLTNLLQKMKEGDASASCNALYSLNIPLDEQVLHSDPVSSEYFVFEGCGTDYDLYKCRRCKAEVKTERNESPHSVHLHAEWFNNQEDVK